jgi:hypothetical protein
MNRRLKSTNAQALKTGRSPNSFVDRTSNPEAPGSMLLAPY